MMPDTAIRCVSLFQKEASGMDLLKQMADAFVILIRTGAVFRVIYCLVRMGMNEEEAPMHRKRARNTVVFYVIAESIWQFKELILNYYQ